MQEYTNIAFISYKREDEKWAKWLQCKLEHYRIPSVVCQENPNAPKKLRPVFRDKTDLASGTLEGGLHQALLDSHYLIVICSPNATKSPYVNLEAQTFVDEGRAADIIPFIVKGIPYAKDKTQECYPEALLNLPKEQELLGVNIQEVGKQKALVRVAAHILGVRFDTLWGRYRRFLIRIRILMAVLISLVLGAVAFVWDYNRATYEYYADYVDCFGSPKGVIELTKDQVTHRNCCYQFEYRRTPLDEPNAYQWRLAKVSYINSAKRAQEVTNTEMKDRYPIVELEYNPMTGNLAHLAFCNKQGRVLLRHKLSERNRVPATVVDLESHDEQQGSAFIGANMASMSMGLMDQSQKKSNIIRLVYERNEQGYIVKQTFHANNDPNPSRSAICDENGIFGMEYDLDSIGRRVAVHYLGLNGERVATKIGVASKSYEYDQYGNIYKATYLNLDNQPTLNEQLWAICIDSANEDGNIVQESYFGTDGQPCLSKNGIAKLTAHYDERGNRIEEVSCFDIYNHPCLHRNGFSRYLSQYDKCGNIVEESYFGTDGQPCLCDAGYAKVTFHYDERGNKDEVSYFGTDGQPCLCNDGFAKWTAHYDERGNMIEQSYFGTDGHPCLCSYGHAKGKLHYDDRENMDAVSYFGTDGQPCLCKDGFAKLIAHYDDRGNRDAESYFGTDGQPCLCSYGYAKVTFHYEERGNQDEISYFGTDGQPCLSNDGYAKWTAHYDERENMIEESYSGPDGQPCLCINGYAKCIYRFDVRGNIVEQTYYDEHDCLCSTIYHVAKIKLQYDERKNIIETTYFGTDGQPCLIKDGIAKWTAHYDERGNMIEQSYFGTDGQLCLCSYGYAKVTFHYEERGNMDAVSYFGTDGQPCLCKDGFAKLIAHYDERGNMIEEAVYDTSGLLCMSALGYAREECVYEEGIYKGSIYYDANNQPLQKEKKVKYYQSNQEKKRDGTLIYLSVEDEKGLAKQSGLDGIYCLLKFNEWNMYNDINLLSHILSNNKEDSKHLLLVPLIEERNIWTLGELIEIDLPGGYIGARLFESSENDRFNELVDIYEAYKKNREK